MELLYIFYCMEAMKMCISLVISWGLGGWIVDEEMTVCVYYSSVSGLLRIDGTDVHLLIFTFYNRELSVQ